MIGRKPRAICGRRPLATEELLTVIEPIQGVLGAVIRGELQLVEFWRDWIRDSPVVVVGGGEKRVPSTPLNRTPGGSCGAAVVIGGVVEKTGDGSGPRAHAGISDGERGNCN